MSKRIQFGGKERTLRYDIAAMLDMEAAMDGKPSGEIVASLGKWSFRAFVIVLWAGLKHEDKGLSLNLTRKHLEHYVTLAGSNIRQLRRDVTDAIEASAWYKQIDTEEDDDADGAEGDGAEPNPTQ